MSVVFTEFDTRMMARALQLARCGRYSVMPNPHVGCVLVQNGHVIGEGFSRPAGGNHAEIEALRQAGDARGATAYVTLEPCSHQGKTGPCAEALVQAGVARVVAAMEDPNPQVSGRGLERLHEAGIEVGCGLLQAEAEQVIPGFIARMRRGRGRVRAKLAMSLDGRTAMASGESQWITGPSARRDVQRLRAMSCAVVTGVGTVLADDCALTVREHELGMPPEEAARAAARQPLRVVLDSRLQTPQNARILSLEAPTLICHAAGAELAATVNIGTDSDSVASHAHEVGQCVDYLTLPSSERGLDLQALFAELNRRQCNEILVESGPRLVGGLLQAGLLDQLIVYMAPCLLGSAARPLLQLPLETMAEKVELAFTDVRRVGADWRFTVEPRY